MTTNTAKKYFRDKPKKKWIRRSITIFCCLFLFFIASWFLTVSIGIKTVKKRHEAFLESFYIKCKKKYKENPKIAITWSTPQMGVTPSRANFWKRKLFKEKQYPSFEEWRKFHGQENTISYFAVCPFIIKSKHYIGNTAWLQEYYFWYFWDTRKYKHKTLTFID